MTSESFLCEYDKHLGNLALPLGREDMLAWLDERAATPADLDLIESFFQAMERKKREKVIEVLMKLSRIPQKDPRTFDNFNTELLNSQARKVIESLETLSFINSKRNIIMLGPTGTGKTHLAMAIGNKCCRNCQKAYFIKMSELKDRFHTALVNDTQGKLINGLSKYSCLIVDEVGYCKFSKPETLLFFQLVDRISLKENGSIVITTNKDLSQWYELFDEDDAIECTIDRLWDSAIILNFSGASHRGLRKEQVNLDFTKLR